MTIRQKLTAIMLVLSFLAIGMTASVSYYWHLRTLRELSSQSIESTGEMGKDYVTVVVVVTVLMGAVATVTAFILNARLVRPLNMLTDMANALAHGDFHREIPVRRNDEIGKLANAFRATQSSITEMTADIAGLSLSVQEGKLDSRGRADKFTGEWRELTERINAMIEAFVTPFTITTTLLERIARGDIPNRVLEEYHGDFKTLIQTLNTLIDAMNEITWLAVTIANGTLDIEARERSDQDRLMKALNTMIHQLNTIFQEMNTLIQAVQDGELETRGNTETLIGGWRNLVLGINSLIDAFVTPILMTAASLDRISRGDIPEKITQTSKGDFNQIKNNLNMLIDVTNDVTRLAEEMAKGNLTIEVQERSRQDALMYALKTMTQRVKEVVSHVKMAADSVAAGSEELMMGAETMSHGAAQQASATEEVSASMEQMAANIQQNADNASQTEKIAMKAADDAKKAGKAVAKTVKAIKKIAKKIAMIENIAEQTRLLSLNATIESGKAQEHGKGFAVVATEVRTLADESRKAAEEITELAISGVSIAQKAGKRLSRLIPDIQKTAELVQEISAASSEQSAGAQHINNAVQQLDQVIQQNVSTTKELATTTTELASQAEQLQDAIMFFTVQETAEEMLEPGEDDDAAEKTIREQPNEEKTSGDKKKEHPDTGEQDKECRDSSSDGHKVRLQERGQTVNELDAEFERY